MGRIEWDESRTPGKVRGTVRTRDGADKPRRLVAVRDTREEVEAELIARAAALLYRGDSKEPTPTGSRSCSTCTAVRGSGTYTGPMRRGVESPGVGRAAGSPSRP